MKFQDSEKITRESCRMHRTLINDDGEFESLILLKFKYRTGDQISQTFYKIGAPQKFGSLFLISGNFKKSEKGMSQSSKMHSNLINDEEFGSLKFLNLKHCRGDLKIQTVCRIVWPRS